MSEPKPSVIVATEHESVVRFYAGHVGNGGIAQTGQFTTTRAIDPTDLANMAVDLSATFGWLQVQPVAAPAAVRALPTATTALPPAEPDTRPWEERRTDSVACPECGKTFKRTSLGIHMHNVHKYARARANHIGRTAPRADANHRTRRRTATKPSHSFWKQHVACPFDGCAHVSTRSNMSTHLQTRKHGVARGQANAMSRELPTVDKVVSNRPRGPHVTNKRTNEVVAALRRHGGHATSAELARTMGVDVSVIRKRMTRGNGGAWRDVTPSGAGANAPRTWELIDSDNGNE